VSALTEQTATREKTVNSSISVRTETCLSLRFGGWLRCRRENAFLGERRAKWLDGLPLTCRSCPCSCLPRLQSQLAKVVARATVGRYEGGWKQGVQMIDEAVNWRST
jgi:hypothetical protein